MCLYRNVDNEITPSQLKNCLYALVDMKNTIGCLGKKRKMIIKIILFVFIKLETCVEAGKNIFQRPKTFSDFAVSVSGERVLKCEMTSLGLH